MRHPLLFTTALVVALLAPTLAHANCTTANLAGDWVLLVLGGNGLDQCNMTIHANGSATGTCKVKAHFDGTLALSSTCRISGKIENGILYGRTEMIPTNSPVKPNLFDAFSPKGADMVWGFRK